MSGAFLVTGATDGIGRATARALAGRGATVILHGRNPAKLEATLAALRAETGSAALHGELADFARLDDVAALAARVRDRHPGLRVLVNNAGLLTDHHQRSADGHELTFAVNVLAPALLTLLLLDTLRTNAPARIVHVASTALGGGTPDFGNTQLVQRFDGWRAYANTKLMNALFSLALARRLAGTGVVSNALCPGLIDTNFFHTNTVFAGGFYERLKPSMRPAADGALVPLHLATDPAAGEVNGTFWVREGRDATHPVAIGLDPADAETLWTRTREALRPWLPAA